MVKGYKAFDKDWACRPTFGKVKQYSCPGIFKTDSEPSVCNHGMHFCKELKDVFDYYSNSPEEVRIAEVIAHGKVAEHGNKCSTNKLEIVREIPWEEVYALVNQGKGCSGICNTGDWNTGNRNTGDWNTGNRNTGNRNTGDCNTGDWNTGNRNTGDWNTGNRNTGNRNTGNWNTGNRNTGDWNTGNRNTGNRNTGDCNTGDWNTGNRNTGDWNKTSFSSGCFCTEEPKIMMFNKPSEWTMKDWFESEARYILNQIPKNVVEWVYECDMTDEEKTANPSYKTTGGYCRIPDESENAQRFWDGLPDSKRQIIYQLPNFDPKVFEECTGIKI